MEQKQKKILGYILGTLVLYITPKLTTSNFTVRA